jgi:hypothetical protein
MWNPPPQVTPLCMFALFEVTASRPTRESRLPTVNQPILRHTGGSGGAASAFPALLYDAVRGHFPQGCIPLARKNGRCSVARPRRSPLFIRRYAPKKTRGQSRNCAEPKSTSPGGDCCPRTIQNSCYSETTAPRIGQHSAARRDLSSGNSPRSSQPFDDTQKNP